ncbi:molybdenum cofactor guanylyltransferase [Candidatus Acidulodesulfobacterium sp. H_13]|uniref:molybdenum cofactor guanylyltransferase n=1 Tax=Candidatus Acidulodesulfobacterium sp. H_13 TaxID=3395470 RepID=UPI003AF7B132
MISSIILAGGESKRFGEDKAFFKFDGASFLERVLRVAAEVSDDIAVCVREESKVKDYDREIKRITKNGLRGNDKDLVVRIIPDDRNCGIKGPMRGIYSSIGYLSGESILVMECDAPFFNADAAKELIKTIKSESVKAVVPLQPDSTVEPLLACYKRKDTLCLLDMLNNYALNLGDDFLFNDSVNILRLLSSVYYYNILDMVKSNKKLRPDVFINMNSKKELKTYMSNKRIPCRGIAKSVKIKKANRFFDLTSPKGAPYGILAKALYYWWVYAKTKNDIYAIKSFEYFKKDGSMYFNNGLDFMGGKILKLLPDRFNILMQTKKEVFL